MRHTILRRIREDNRSGASALTREAANLLLMELDAPYRSLAELRQNLLTLGQELISAQPMMAPIFNLVNGLLLKAQEGLELEETKEGCRQQIKEYLARLEESLQSLALEAASLIQEGLTILTHSYSSAVEAAFCAAGEQGKDFVVVATESRPVLEGRALALRLLERGIKVKLVADGAAFRLSPSAQAIFVGADTISSQGIVNKIGTFGLAMAARHLSIPFFVLASTEKVLPQAASFFFKEEPRAAEELWAHTDSCLEVVNLYYDLTPLDLITAIISEKGRKNYCESVHLGAGWPVFPALRG